MSRNIINIKDDLLLKDLCEQEEIGQEIDKIEFEDEGWGDGEIDIEDIDGLESRITGAASQDSNKTVGTNSSNARADGIIPRINEVEIEQAPLSYEQYL